MPIPAASLVAIPEDISARHAAVTEPAATALHAVNVSMRAHARPLPECRAGYRRGRDPAVPEWLRIVLAAAGLQI